MNADDLMRVYAQLRDQYSLTCTNTLAVDDGFTEDMPVIVGRNGSSSFWLYEDGGDFVFSVEIPGQQHHNHRHPQCIEEALQVVIDFMENR